MAENVQAVVRAFAVVRAVVAGQEPVLLGDIAAAAQVPKSTARRLLATLQSIGMIDRGPVPGTYVPGAGLSVLAPEGLGNGALFSLAGPFLRDVVELVAEDATLAVVDGGSVLFAEQVSGPNPIQVPDGTGIRYPIHTVASGYLFMSDWAAPEVAEYCEAASLDLDEVRSRVAAGIADGFVWFDAWLDGITAVAAPIVVHERMVGTIGAFGPSYRFPGERNRSELGNLVAGVAANLGRLID